MITFNKVGVTLIDEQHQELINRINQVTSMGIESVSKEQTEKTLDFLGDYIVKHFGDEEVLQKKSGYPQYEWHKEQHQIYIDNFKKLKAEFMANGASIKYTMDLNNSIIDWIVKHIKNVDTKLGLFLQEKGMANDKV
ncbi:MAG: bacteriohemerythrin [Spirochaetaceae bacterium]|jgi:hemerythrin|nr:bacteriohemerythrin [Spirochaetaceae bacterium]